MKVWRLAILVIIIDIILGLCLTLLYYLRNQQTAIQNKQSIVLKDPLAPTRFDVKPENKVPANGKRSNKVLPHQHIKIKIRDVNYGNVKRFLANN